MKRLWIVILLAAVGLHAEEPPPLLKNASFEIPLDPDNWACDQPAHWIRWGNWMNLETAWAPTKTGQCMMGFHHFRLKGEDNAGFYQDVRDVRGGREYAFSIFAWIDKETNAEEIHLMIASYHGGSVLLDYVYKVGKLPRDQWVRLATKFRTPNDGARVMVFVEPHKAGKFAKGAIKFDEASLQIPEDGDGATSSQPALSVPTTTEHARR